MQLDGFHCNWVNYSIQLADKGKATAREDTGTTGRDDSDGRRSSM